MLRVPSVTFQCKESVGPGRETQRNAVRRSARQPHALFVYHILLSFIAFLSSDSFPSFQTLDNDGRPCRNGMTMLLSL